MAVPFAPLKKKGLDPKDPVLVSLSVMCDLMDSVGVGVRVEGSVGLELCSGVMEVPLSSFWISGVLCSVLSRGARNGLVVIDWLVLAYERGWISGPTMDGFWRGALPFLGLTGVGSKSSSSPSSLSPSPWPQLLSH